MKFIKQGLFLLVYLLTVSIPITTYAAGEGNIDHGGGMLGEGTGTVSYTHLTLPTTPYV